jgi:hypothetical protein
MGMPPMGGPPMGGFMGPPMGHPAPPQMEPDEPPSKRIKTEESLMPEEDFLRRNRVRIRTPSKRTVLSTDILEEICLFYQLRHFGRNLSL